MNISTKKLKEIVIKMIEEMENEVQNSELLEPEMAASSRQKMAKTLQQITSTTLQIEKLEQILGSEELLSYSKDQEIIDEFIKRVKETS